MVDAGFIAGLANQQMALYGIADPSTELVTYAVGKAMEYVKNFCNINEIPDGLAYAVADLACAGYIDTARITGLIEDGNVSSVKVGDTQVTMGTDTPSWSSIVDTLRSQTRSELLRYRKMCF